jgi:hypothetical protein
MSLWTYCNYLNLYFSLHGHQYRCWNKSLFSNLKNRRLVLSNPPCSWSFLLALVTMTNVILTFFSISLQISSYFTYVKCKNLMKSHKIIHHRRSILFSNTHMILIKNSIYVKTIMTFFFLTPMISVGATRFRALCIWIDIRNRK